MMDSLETFEALGDWEPFVLLESQSYHPLTGRRSLLGLGPRPVFTCASADPSAPAAMQRAINQWLARQEDGFLFMAFAYEWKNVWEGGGRETDFPLASLIACRNAVVWDHEKGAVHFHGDGAQDIRRILSHGSLPMQPDEPCAAWPVAWQHSMARDTFIARAKKIQEYIAAGDIYQANLSQRFTARTDASGLYLYKAYRAINPSPFGGYFRIGDWEIISCSPERLIARQGERIQTRPIAGTRPRGREPRSDAGYQAQLLMSPKERAEHIMLVDLERNDLGRVCHKGSVEVDEMMAVEKYSHVQHIVSNVRGMLVPGVDFTRILQAVFPGGTITGVPKIRCMQILDELEPLPRGPYTGSFGYMDARGDFDLNIVIRTLVKRGDEVFAQTGAGIVADSDPAAEYQETLDKAQAMLLAVGNPSARIPAAPAEA